MRVSMSILVRTLSAHLIPCRLQILRQGVNFRAAKNPVKVTLKGFTAAFDGPPLKRNEVQDRQKQLEAELQKKAKETADKLKAAQDAAKSGN